jgi:hypothetical protein
MFFLYRMVSIWNSTHWLVVLIAAPVLPAGTNNYLHPAFCIFYRLTLTHACIDRTASQLENVHDPSPDKEGVCEQKESLNTWNGTLLRRPTFGWQFKNIPTTSLKSGHVGEVVYINPWFLWSLFYRSRLDISCLRMFPIRSLESCPSHWTSVAIWRSDL